MDFMQISYESFRHLPFEYFFRNCISLSASCVSVRRHLDLLSIVHHHLIFSYFFFIHSGSAHADGPFLHEVSCPCLAWEKKIYKQGSFTLLRIQFEFVPFNIIFLVISLSL